MTTIEDEITAWNTEHPIGTPVLFWPGGHSGTGRPSMVRSAAWDVCGTAVVAVAGYAGGVALTHIQPTTLTRFLMAAADHADQTADAAAALYGDAPWGTVWPLAARDPMTVHIRRWSPAAARTQAALWRSVGSRHTDAHGDCDRCTVYDRHGSVLHAVPFPCDDARAASMAALAYLTGRDTP